MRLQGFRWLSPLVACDKPGHIFAKPASPNFNRELLSGSLTFPRRQLSFHKMSGGMCGAARPKMIRVDVRQTPSLQERFNLGQQRVERFVGRSPVL